MIIAIDFDGTIVEHKYPEIGNEIPGAFETLKWMQEQGCQLVLNTCREGPFLREAIKFCRKNGIEFISHNVNDLEQISDWEHTPRKVYANIYIDDRNLGGFPGWNKVREILEREL